MAVVFACPRCKTVLKGPEELKGKRGRCPKCADVVTVPKESLDANDSPQTAEKQ